MAGIYVDVPDTEHILVILAAAAPLVLLGWPLNLGRLGEAGGYAPSRSVGLGRGHRRCGTARFGRRRRGLPGRIPGRAGGAIDAQRALNRHRLAWLVALHAVGMVALSRAGWPGSRMTSPSPPRSWPALLVGFAFAAALFFVGPIRGSRSPVAVAHPPPGGFCASPAADLLAKGPEGVTVHDRDATPS